ncbi:uncharacterized protein [Cherax quadricarinatus]
MAIGSSIHSYFFCRVRAAVPSAVSNITWFNSNGDVITNVVRRMRGKGTFAARYPALLLVLVGITEGNFTCKAVYNNEVISQNLEVTGNYSTIPEMTQITQVSVEGGNVTLTCDKLSPFLRGTWTFHGEPITSSRRIIITEDALIISATERQDFGEYQCHIRSSRLHYYHTTVITLLLAQGPSTLITHYTITSQPPPPTPLVEPSCTTQRNATDESVKIAAWGLGGPGTRRCPPPYKTLEGHCLLVAPGDVRSWHRARTQCRRQGGDLLVIQEPALMLALIQLFHSQGLGNTSFWVGGVKRGVEEWWWVDGTYLTLGSSFWYPTFARRPKEVPEARMSLRDSIFTRRKGTHAPSMLRSAGRHNRIPGRIASCVQSNISHIPGKSISHIQSSTAPQAGKFHQENTSGAPPEAVRVSSNSGHQGTRWWTSRRTPSNYKSLVIHPMKQHPMKHQHRQTVYTSGERDSKGHWSREAQGDKSYTSARKRKFLKKSFMRARRREDQELQTQEAHKFVVGEGQLGADVVPKRAVCLWARFRHFFASCSVTERLKALCEYKFLISKN